MAIDPEDNLLTDDVLAYTCLPSRYSLTQGRVPPGQVAGVL